MQEDKPLNASQFQHKPVMGEEVINSIKNLPQDFIKNGLIIDATLGAGGHSALILNEYKDVQIIGLDQDPDAIRAASKRLINFGSRVQIISTNFADFTPKEKVNCVIADLGVSSPQLDQSSRGFSFRLNGPIDMRMNPSKGIKASELIEKLNEEQLADLIYQFGEEKLSRRIAKRIKNDLYKNGAYSGTSELAYAIAGCFPPKQRHKKIHPATRTFQALRIAVNNELEVLKNLLNKSPDWIIPNGLLIIISFHSLEDRIVKHSFNIDKRLDRITKKPLQATYSEVLTNPRSRSAKLRIAKRNYE